MQEHDPLTGGAYELPQPAPKHSGESASAQPRAAAASANGQRGKNGHRARVGAARSAALASAAPKPPVVDVGKTAQPSAQPARQARLARFRDLLPGGLTRLNWPLLLLLALLAGALALRLYGLEWDANQEQHPDERAIIMAVGNFQWPHSLSEFLSVQSPLSPHFLQPDFVPFFAYGTFPLYALWLLAQFLNWLQQAFGLHWIPAGQGSFTDSIHLTLVGRALSALFDTGTVLVTYLLGRRLSGKKAVGLLAAAFVAFTPFEVQLAHFFTVDTALTFFIVLALYAYVGVAQGGGLGWVVLSGVATGLALASKFSALPLLLPLLLAYILYWQRSEFLLALPRLLISLGAGLLTFISAMPYALIDLPDFEAAIKQQSDLTTGTLDFPYVHQFAGTTPYLYELKNMLFYDLGVPLALLALVGCVVVVRRVWRDW
ncbi:MAG TPA: glycosyltransferase family 39 protein, partial [Ktedonobacterales bacterium]|nr:glycosyltransferase family 39 protein [Ktedonobacterales bacterium]